jgi:hypothetical protein
MAGSVQRFCIRSSSTSAFIKDSTSNAVQAFDSSIPIPVSGAQIILRSFPSSSKQSSLGVKGKNLVIDWTMKEAPTKACKKDGCSQFRRCCEGYDAHCLHAATGPRKDYTPQEKTVARTPNTYEMTGTGGTANHTPIDIRPPYYAVASIMQMS